MRLPLATHTAYQDLLEAHRARNIARIAGTPFLKELPQGNYWYARQKIGEKIVDRYIGPDSDDLRQRIAKMRETIEDDKAFEQHCSLLVAQLRAAGLPTVDRQTGSVLNAMAGSACFAWAGRWSEHMHSGSIVLNWALPFQARLPLHRMSTPRHSRTSNSLSTTKSIRHWPKPSKHCLWRPLPD